MNRTLILLGLTLAGCPRKPSGETGHALAEMKTFAENMCRCKDKACADAVQAAMTSWAAQMAKDGRGADEHPGEAVMNEMVATGERYAECMTNAFMPAQAPPQTPSAVTPKPAPSKLSAPADHPTIAKLIQEAKGHARASEQHLVMSQLTARFVASDGMLDPTYGELTIAFGNPPLAAAPGPVDDPVRPTGAPLPTAPKPTPDEDSVARRPLLAKCPKGVWSSKTGWTWAEPMCWEERELAPRCSIQDVWSRAKANQAPANAVAILNLRRFANGTQSWQFSISDELRKVDIRLQIKDDCAAIVEKP